MVPPYFKITLKRSFLAVAALLVSISVGAADRPNILFIVTDDHGWGDLPANWDKTEVQLPTLDGLAAGGARFTNYHTVPLCAPSRACMFTGQYSSENSMWRGPGGVPGDPGLGRLHRARLHAAPGLPRPAARRRA